MDIPLAVIGLLLTTFAAGLPAAARRNQCRSSARPLAWIVGATGAIVTVTALAA